MNLKKVKYIFFNQYASLESNSLVFFYFSVHFYFMEY